MSTIAVNAITDAIGGNTASINGATPTTDNLIGRNRIINGNFDIWQRGTSQTTAGYGSADRWGNNHSGSTKTTSQQDFAIDQTDVPNNPKYFMRTVVTTANSSSNYVQSKQAIEDLRQFSGETVTLSFWAKADATKNIAVEFRQDEDDGSGSVSHYHSVSLTTSWQKFTITQTITAIPSGVTLGVNNNLALVFWFDAGSNFTSINPITGSQSGTFDIAQVQLEAGSVATSFERRSYGQELALCQRYYQAYSRYEEFVQAQVTSSSAATASFGFIQPMRTSPTVTLAAAGSSTGQIAFLTATGSYPAVIGSHSALSITTYGFRILGTGYTASGWAAGAATSMYAQSNPTTVVQASAEL